MEDFVNDNKKEIVLTEVVAPPKDSSFSSDIPHSQNNNDTSLSLEDAVQNLDNLDTLFETQDEPVQPIDDANLDELLQTVLTEDAPPSQIQELLDDSTDMHSETTPQQSTEQEISEENKKKNISNQEFLEEVSSLEESPSNNEETADPALDKLDNLDAMIDTMIAAPTSVDTALTEQIELLTQRIEKLEATPVLESKKDESLQELHERILVLEGQYSSLQTSVEEMHDHLHTLLSIPKKINDIEKQVQILPSIEAIEEGLSFTSLNERIHTLQNAFDTTTEAMNTLSALEQRLQSIESQFFPLLEETPWNTETIAEKTITEKLHQLEHTIDTILEKQLSLEKSTSIETLQEALLPSIEKEAILAASRIIKEELQTILEWK